MIDCIDMTGLTFGRLTVDTLASAGSDSRATWWCVCACGNRIQVIGRNLRTGNTKSCGCLRNEIAANRTRTHGRSDTPEYGIWVDIIQRCENTRRPAFKNYGGRGINVCDRWKKFENFFADMGQRPAGHEIERKDNNKGYSPDNCIWVPEAVQHLNTRRTRWLEVDGEKLALAEVARRFNVKACTIHMRLRRGWPIDRAIGREVSP